MYVYKCPEYNLLVINYSLVGNLECMYKIIIKQYIFDNQ